MPCGWSVLPVTDKEGYITSGKYVQHPAESVLLLCFIQRCCCRYRLPLFTGSPPADLVASIATQDCSVFLNESLRAFKIKRLQV